VSVQEDNTSRPFHSHLQCPVIDFPSAHSGIPMTCRRRCSVPSGADKRLSCVVSGRDPLPPSLRPERPLGIRPSLARNSEGLAPSIIMSIFACTPESYAAWHQLKHNVALRSNAPQHARSEEGPQDHESWSSSLRVRFSKRPQPISYSSLSRHHQALPPCPFVHLID
jgi:hypothetical protein